uniref:Uncharacterized protein n=1 Tax=Rhizophora mucronata TaxID=61149 RepID=A0A2P2Q943_RHIMU
MGIHIYDLKFLVPPIFREKFGLVHSFTTTQNHESKHFYISA